jgi:hypothetical protein
MKYDIPEEYKQFVAYVRRRCKIKGIELMLSPSRNVVITDSFSTDCSGYFDDVNKVLVVACGRPFNEWIEILIHEYSHMQQWTSDDRWTYWTDCCLDLWAWLDKEKTMNGTQLGKVLDGMVDLERDCELRAIENIKKWKLPINKAQYQRKANLYLYSYKLMAQLKKFPSGIYDNKEIVAMCPSRIVSNKSSVPDNIAKAILDKYT